MTNVDDLFKKTLKQHGFSLTTVRQAVFTQIAKHGAVTMKQLIDAVNFDRASVYRSVDLFVSLSIAHRVYTGWKYKIELSDTFDNHHHHATCLVCGRVITLAENQALESALQSVAKKHGFSLQSHQVELSGLCHGCSSRKN